MKPFKLTALAMTAVILGSAIIPANAHAASSFNPKEVEAAITEFYGFYNSQSSTIGGYGLSDIDKNELADAIADQIAVLGPGGFNDVIGHLAADYRQNPENRAAVEALMAISRFKVMTELLANDERTPLMTVLDDVFVVWSAAYMFGFGKGLWKSRGSGLKGVARFRHSVETVAGNLPKGRMNLLKIAGIGTSVGLVHSVYNYLETKKRDPMMLLRTIQTDVVHDLGVRAAGLRDVLKAINPNAPNLEIDALRMRLSSADKEISSLEQQLMHLFTSATQLRGRMQPITEDIQVARSLIARLGMQFDIREIGDVLP
jgi:hypothetical protein